MRSARRRAGESDRATRLASALDTLGMPRGDRGQLRLERTSSSPTVSLLRARAHTINVRGISVQQVCNKRSLRRHNSW